MMIIIVILTIIGIVAIVIWDLLSKKIKKK